MEGRVRVSGDLVVARPGARPVPIRVSGSPERLRLEVESGLAASRLGGADTLRALGALLARLGVTAVVATPTVRLVHLGEPDRPVRVTFPGAAWTLLTTAPWRLPALVRAVIGSPGERVERGGGGDSRSEERRNV